MLESNLKRFIVCQIPYLVPLLGDCGQPGAQPVDFGLQRGHGGGVDLYEEKKKCNKKGKSREKDFSL